MMNQLTIPTIMIISLARSYGISATQEASVHETRLMGKTNKLFPDFGWYGSLVWRLSRALAAYNTHSRVHCTWRHCTWRHCVTGGVLSILPISPGTRVSWLLPCRGTWIYMFTRVAPTRAPESKAYISDQTHLCSDTAPHLAIHPVQI